MKKSLTTLVLFALLITGCTSSGAFLSANQTIVSLDEGNYTIAAQNVSGEAEASYILGVSYSSGLLANTMAIARVNGSGTLYADALENLWENVEQENGEVSGRKLALINVRYDSDILNLLVYTKVTLSIRADVVEFE